MVLSGKDGSLPINPLYSFTKTTSVAEIYHKDDHNVNFAGRSTHGAIESSRAGADKQVETTEFFFFFFFGGLSTIMKVFLQYV